MGKVAKFRFQGEKLNVIIEEAIFKIYPAEMSIYIKMIKRISRTTYYTYHLKPAKYPPINRVFP